MLQALNIKNIDPKASVKAQGKVAEEAQVADAESVLEGADFANELMASLAMEEGKLVTEATEATEVSPDQAMEASPALIQLPELKNPDLINHKAFDPALTQDVGEIIQPVTTQVPAEISENIDPEIAQALLKTPQVQTGRAPAIDLARAEVDSQLMNMDDFVAQKNLAVKKSLNNSSAYGMPTKTPINKASLEHDLKSTQTINEIGASASESNGSAMNSQQFILNSQIDLGSSHKSIESQAPVKAFDMSHIKTDNPNQIMTQITDYIVQAKAAKEPTVNMRVNHEELGMIDITVQKTGMTQEAIAINIGTHSLEGKNFFQSNSKDLFSHLTNTGLNISDLKVETPSQTAKSDFDFGSQSGRGGAGTDRQFGSEQNQKRQESERRQDLWNLLKDKEAA
jgi:hypothetical protein